MNARWLAARALCAVTAEGRSLAVALPPLLAEARERDRGLVQELAYGSVRWQPRLVAALSRLLKKPLKARDRDLECLLLVGLYQLAFLDLKPHAAVHETVEAARAAGKPWAAGLVNGVLRSFQRRAGALSAELDADPVARLAHPAWLLERFRADWPDDWEALAEAGNARPPMSLRVNLRQGAREDYLERLAAEGIEAKVATCTEAGLVLEAPVAVERLPGFTEGAVSVQDVSAQLAAPLLDVRPGMRVLDACAAPGGKTCHILERTPDIELLALDADAGRLQAVADNLARLSLSARLIAGDAAEPAAWWDGRPFDRILLDAPCSGTGVIRRHPDIKLLRRPGDIPRLAATQTRLLDALWPLLRPGGMLLYATCSVLREENEHQAAAFVERTPDAMPLPIEADWGRPAGPGRQILTGPQGGVHVGMDGFYYARLTRRV
ncbi:MAG TPA: 16S rRNA (cytosine(967)-C(5))-methyltransferase RsmB [Thiotrichales bacterium]|nr:16S rRNA (cytosine(967)-C(5))-methyltransferase RsmB [Thiotrichales bacterium]